VTEAAKPPAPKRRTLIAVVGAACALIASPFVAGWESGGTPRLTAYRDVAGIWTICDGVIDGVRPGMTETLAGCEARREAELIRHADPVLACTPALRGRPHQLAAAVSLAYNIGTGGYCQSSAARLFNAGQWRAACDAFLPWNKARVNGTLTVVRGLARRREAERALCLKDLPR
jgi:lysozyme